ncbi:MAG TPA: ABC transporter permease [Gemmatimonadales bacterium]|nr:ABC transporter permease [Gemmatimonadales bacterium]
MDVFWRDARFAVRSLLRSPAFTAIAVLTLALGIGANTAIFSVVYSVLLRPLAYAEPERLISIRAAYSATGAEDIPASQPEYHDYLQGVSALEDLAAVYPISINLTGLGEPQRIQASVVSDNYFRLLGVAPALGRDFTPDDDRGQIGYVVIISHDLWRKRFGGDPGVIGKTVRLDDDPMTIIGIMPRGFRHVLESGTSPMELWAPIALDNPDTGFLNVRNARVYDLIGRLKPGRTVAEARSEFGVLAARLQEQYPEVYPAAQGWHPVAQPLAEQVVGDVRPALLVLLGAVGFVLLIGCANVANLLLARATMREREIALRTALGSSRGRLVRQLLTESLVLAIFGGGLGLLLAAWGTSALGRLVAAYLPRAGEIELSLPVLGFSAFLIILTGVVFGLMPALQASRADLQGVLKDAGRGSAGAPRTRMRAALVVAEVAIALMLLAGAGLMLRSFQRLMAVEYGFDPDRLLTLQVWLPVPNDRSKGRFQTHAQRRSFYERALAAVGAVPGVRDAALISRLPLTGQNDARLTIEGRAVGPDEPPVTAEGRLVSPNYFETMGIPLLSGEGLPEVADSLSRRHVVVNRTMAEKFWPDADAIGRRLRFGDNAPWLTVVGIVGDVRQIGLTDPPKQEVYSAFHTVSSQEMSVVVRTVDDDPERLGAAVTAAIRSVDPEQPVFGVMSMERVIENASAERRISMVLLLLFAGMALVLSAIGIYGVMAYTTTQRRHEIGIRLALGAGTPEVLRLVVGQGMRLVLLGLVAGLLGAWVLSRALTSQLYGVTAQDPLTFMTVALLLGTVALVATWVPARRATRVDPMISLRSE